MNKELISEIESLSVGNIDFFIQFWSDQTNIKMADIDPLQADILFYLNSLKHFWTKAEEMQKTLEWYAESNIKDIFDDMGDRAREALKGGETK